MEFVTNIKTHTRRDKKINLTNFNQMVKKTNANGQLQLGSQDLLLQRWSGSGRQIVYKSRPAVIRISFEFEIIGSDTARIYQGVIDSRKTKTSIPPGDDFVDHTLDGAAKQYLWIRYNRTNPSSYLIDNTANDPIADEIFAYLVLGEITVNNGVYKKAKIRWEGDRIEDLSLQG